MVFFYPIIFLILVYIIFIYLLSKKLEIDFFAEIGVLYMSIFMAYSVIPALTFIFTKLNSNDALAKLLPDDDDLVNHLWRHVLFAVFFSLGYIVFRGNENFQDVKQFKQIRINKTVFYFILFCVILCIFYLNILSAPLETYYDSFTRYDHLPWGFKKLASLLIRFKFGFYAIALTFLFLNFEKYKILSLFFVLFICIFEIIDSYGARIIGLIILLQVSCLYSLVVAKLSIKKGIVFLFALVVLFTTIEISREAGFDFSDTKSNINNDGYRTATEFASVFYPGYHLYTERQQFALPQRPWPMFFYDIISIFTFGDFDKWNPMAWYNKYYYPDIDVYPFTVGPIAESALWGGEIDLVIRSFINGLFFAFIIRWFLKKQTKWWALVIYSYIYSTCIMTLKYSVFYHLTPIFKNMLPTILITSMIIYLTKKNKQIKDITS